MRALHFYPDHPNEEGTPQGGSISVLLSNVYLHYVLDLWFEHVGKCNVVPSVGRSRRAYPKVRQDRSGKLPS